MLFYTENLIAYLRHLFLQGKVMQKNCLKAQIAVFIKYPFYPYANISLIYRLVFIKLFTILTIKLCLVIPS